MADNTVVIADPSMSDLRSMLATPVAEPKHETSEPVVTETPAESTPEAATETAEKTPELEKSEPAEEPLPEGVQKRIAKEVEKATRIQAEIDRAVSQRKAKEAELAQVTAKTGSEPEPTTAPADAKPKRPTFGETGYENESWKAFEDRQATYEDARDVWSRKEALREFEQKDAIKQAQANRAAWMQKGSEAHGKDFPAKVKAVEDATPPQLQTAIGGLEKAHAVAVYLADNPHKIQELVEEFNENPYRAIIKLGRIEASLTSQPKPVTPAVKPLPEPLAKVGGSASASGQDLQSALEGGSMSQFKRLVQKRMV